MLLSCSRKHRRKPLIFWGGNIPKRSASCSGWGWILEVTRRFDEAAAIAEDVLGKEESFGTTHPETISAENSLKLINLKRQEGVGIESI